MELIRLEIFEFMGEEKFILEDEIHVKDPHRDYSLCGDDITGDFDRKITTGDYKKITCKKCIVIIDFCKSIPKSKVGK